MYPVMVEIDDDGQLVGEGEQIIEAERVLVVFDRDQPARGL
jgi:hypothetical protein